ncbi:hypothetical protein BEN30_09385 [Magnetovibrio blakemorei]|uniref:Uncharacterized protein n=1 Tax=Magnetovibrio blakemorei TaxID=28181 RepID=A0A1E5Q8P6_9PROT|nr:hypothetical protein BEN30_09385 [Magnetovibrio blakemorei]
MVMYGHLARYKPLMIPAGIQILFSNALELNWMCSCDGLVIMCVASADLTVGCSMIHQSLKKWKNSFIPVHLTRWWLWTNM